MGVTMQNKSLKLSMCMGNISLKVADLIKNYPPKYDCQRKAQLYNKALRYHKSQRGIIKVSRWTYNKDRKAPITFEKNPVEISIDNNFFRYDDSYENQKTWWLNYADENLFGYYSSDLFAQDEIQTLEHPLLGSIVEYLDENDLQDLKTKTEEKDFVSPYLIENAPYWIKIDTSPILKDGTVGNLYSWNFVDASEEEVNAGISIIQKEIKNNIIAMAAPSRGKGEYTKEQLTRSLETVIVAFGAAKKISNTNKFEKCIIHTGNWGCGAFGNSKELMYLVQILGASVVGVDKLVFHSVDEEIFNLAKNKFNNCDVNDIIGYLQNQHYQWRESDNN